ncbi:hypothetical protein [Helicobacter ailurogastricus]|uniref:hypothetical protein n=1 Tax=Helicobacter ailurogastricus TaxID=1578720 RepID=UPI00244D9525|nr:hypothetical protein [Helicobacter ailurogastricus]GMB91934.1 Sialidase A [Helicobacter ailurogastricus]
MNEQENKLNETLAFLTQKGIKTIAQDTKLANPKIRAILEKDFGAVQRVHAVGFLQIFEKEYGVDLSQWLVEYDKNAPFDKSKSTAPLETTEKPKKEEPPTAKAKLESAPTPQEKRQEPRQEPKPTQESPSPFLDTKRVGEPIAHSPQPKTSKLYFILPLVLVIGALIFYFGQHGFQTQTNASPESKAQTPTPSNNLESESKAATTPQPSAETSAQKTAPSTPSTTNGEETPKDTAQPATTPKEDTPKTTPSTEPAKSAPSEAKETEYPTILITPKGDLWVETIDLKTKQKNQMVLKEPFTLDTQGHSWLLAFGHGHLSVESGNKHLDFNRTQPVRLLYTPKRGFRRLSLAHYKERSQ